jgi:hypothetical protein
VWGDDQQKFAHKVQSNGKHYLLVHGFEEEKRKIIAFQLILAIIRI